MEKMEDFIKNNRESFDVHEATEGLWEKVEHSLLQKRRNKSLRIWVQRAAIFIIIFSMAFGLSEFLHKPAPKQSASNLASVQVQIPQEIRETQAYYDGLIFTRMKEMKPMFTSYPGMEEEVHKDFSRLDSICADLKKDLKDNISNQQVIEAMIENYRTKLGILENLLDALKRKNPDYEKKHI